MSTSTILLLIFLAQAPQPAPPLAASAPFEQTVEARRQTLERLVVVDPGIPRWRGERISLSTKEADLVELLRAFARLADVNLVVDPRVQGRVTVELHDVPWDQALSVILKTHGLGAELDGRLWGIQPAR